MFSNLCKCLKVVVLMDVGFFIPNYFAKHLSKFLVKYVTKEILVNFFLQN